MKMKHLKTQKKKLFLYLSELGSRYNLSFSSQKALGNIAMGLDAPKRKLVVLSQGSDESNSCIIDLEEVACCKLKKVYRDIRASELTKKKLGAFLHSIALQFGFKNSRPPLVLPLYQIHINDKGQLVGLEQKAMRWHAMLSKIISRSNRIQPVETSVPVATAVAS